MTPSIEPFCVKFIFYGCSVTFSAMEVDHDAQLIQLRQNILPKEELLSLQWEEASIARAINIGQESRSSKRRRCRSEPTDSIDGPLDVTSRGHLAYPPSGARICAAPSNWQWISDSAYDAEEYGMASIEREMQQLAPNTGPAPLYHFASKSTTYPAGPEGGGDSQGGGDADADHRRSTLPIPDVASPIEEADGEQGQTFGRRDPGGHPTAVGGNELGKSEHSQISRLEEDSEWSRTTGGHGISLVANDLNEDVCNSTATVLPQHLASRGCGHETTVIEPLTSSQADRCQASQKVLRVCLNPEGLFCWLNSDLSVAL